MLQALVSLHLACHIWYDSYINELAKQIHPLFFTLRSLAKFPKFWETNSRFVDLKDAQHYASILNYLSKSNIANRRPWCWIALVAVFISSAVCEKSYSIKIDGKFDDWAAVPGFSDPDDLPDGSVLQDGIADVHDTSSKERCAQPPHVYNDDANLLEYKFTHDEQHLYAVSVFLILKYICFIYLGVIRLNSYSLAY